jgi:hypothetical protein
VPVALVVAEACIVDPVAPPEPVVDIVVLSPVGGRSESPESCWAMEHAANNAATKIIDELILKTFDFTGWDLLDDGTVWRFQQRACRRAVGPLR